MAYQKKLDAIKMCIQCAHDCTLCAHDCLHLGGEHATPAHQTMLHDCADLCTLVAHFLARHSPNAAAMTTQCAIVCEHCAAGCEKLAHGEGHMAMKKCAKTCRDCAEACEALETVEIT
jgi:hypothetical protein